ncbi:hypothetical protein SISNIDRAFT_399298, partial [Sistotremastrum niveocremeum HHB9708]
LELPEDLKRRNVHPTFHMDMIRPHLASDQDYFPHRDALSFYDFGNDTEVEFFVEEILDHRWNKNKLEFHIKWSLGDDTWEPYESCKELQALTEYLNLQGVSK